MINQSSESHDVRAGALESKFAQIGFSRQINMKYTHNKNAETNQQEHEAKENFIIITFIAFH